jgi:hypothetical protein
LYPRISITFHGRTGDYADTTKEAQLFQKVELLQHMQNMQGAQKPHTPSSKLPADMTNVMGGP